MTERTSERDVPILLIDDDVDLCSSLSRLLAMEGFALTAVNKAELGVRRAIEEVYEMVILDVMLPDNDGRVVLRKLRMNSQVPIIMLTARGDEADRIAGLEGGADDYLPKPFNPRELIARIRAVLKRKGNTGIPDRFNVADLEIDRTQRRVFRGRQEIELTGAEFDILFLLVRSIGKVLSRDEIAEIALNRSLGVFDRSIDNHISNLRKKLGVRVGQVERIRNVRGTGYVYAADVQVGKKL